MTTPSDTEPFLTLHTAVVLLGALFAGLVTGGLSYLGGVHPALSVLSGFTAVGGAVLGLRSLIR
ncbi:hypothetical protein OG730_36165 [Streptomyces sp. NBC_01298]|uniref:hypothetical protein n=1 Tax=Streptomyces sp. NBC_01298 TaxID=2903817 RepID=UPI002E11C03C|nr:hypothetical protein OG730_36165 [Streptomyces sp. NBC_01298]